MDINLNDEFRIADAQGARFSNKIHDLRIQAQRYLGFDILNPTGGRILMHIKDNFETYEEKL